MNGICNRPGRERGKRPGIHLCVVLLSPTNRLQLHISLCSVTMHALNLVFVPLQLSQRMCNVCCLHSLYVVLDWSEVSGAVEHTRSRIEWSGLFIGIVIIMQFVTYLHSGNISTRRSRQCSVVIFWLVVVLFLCDVSPLSYSPACLLQVHLSCHARNIQQMYVLANTLFFHVFKHFVK